MEEISYGRFRWFSLLRLYEGPLSYWRGYEQFLEIKIELQQGFSVEDLYAHTLWSDNYLPSFTTLLSKKKLNKQQIKRECTYNMNVCMMCVD